MSGGPIRRVKKSSRTPTSIISIRVPLTPEPSTDDQIVASPVRPGSLVIQRIPPPSPVRLRISIPPPTRSASTLAAEIKAGLSAESAGGMVIVPPTEPVMTQPFMAITMNICVGGIMPSVQTCRDVMAQIAGVYNQTTRGMQITEHDDEITLSVNLPVYTPAGQTLLLLSMHVVRGRTPSNRVIFRGPVQSEKIWDVLTPFVEKYAEYQLAMMMNELSL